MELNKSYELKLLIFTEFKVVDFTKNNLPQSGDELFMYQWGVATVKL